MALTPEYEVAVPDLFSSTDEVSRTYRVNWDSGRIVGTIPAESDEDSYLDALRQFVYKALQSRRFVNIIYDEDYGSEIEEMQKMGYPRELLKSELQRLITEALVYDERIASVEGFEFIFGRDDLLVKFLVTSARGAELAFSQDLGVT